MAATSTSRLDRFYRRMLITRFFEKGWGKPDNLRRYVGQRQRQSYDNCLVFALLAVSLFLAINAHWVCVCVYRISRRIMTR